MTAKYFSPVFREKIPSLKAASEIQGRGRLLIYHKFEPFCLKCFLNHKLYSVNIYLLEVHILFVKCERKMGKGNCNIFFARFCCFFLKAEVMSFNPFPPLKSILTVSSIFWIPLTHFLSPSSKN